MRYWADHATRYAYGERRFIRQDRPDGGYARHVAVLHSAGPWTEDNEAELLACVAALNAVPERPAPATDRFSSSGGARCGAGDRREVVERYPNGRIRRSAAAFYAPGAWTENDEAEIQACVAALNALPASHSPSASIESEVVFYYPGRAA